MAFVPKQQNPGWGPFAESFLRMNEQALRSLGVTALVSASATGAEVRLAPGDRAGAIPLRSPQTGHVAGGFVVRPRFGWAGIGRVLGETGWLVAPEFLALPMVPGSGREVPPWVLAGPVLTRLAALLASLRKGYRSREETRTTPRGTVRWTEYARESLARGKWTSLPCVFPDLGTDPLLRAHIRWCLERVRLGLLESGGDDAIARGLADLATRLLLDLADVQSRMPRLFPASARRSLESEAMQLGLQAIGWVVEERGLGGGRELDGLAWQLPLHSLWEAYVESVVSKEAALNGSELASGRKRQTVIPIGWQRSATSMGSLVPDFVRRRHDEIEVIDAKYKAHFSELDDSGWNRFAEDARESHRADVHQILAYASLFSARKVIATLVYPLRGSTWAALRARKADVVIGRIESTDRSVELRLRGLPFGRDHENGISARAGWK